MSSIFRLKKPRIANRSKLLEIAEPDISLPGVDCYGLPGACGEIWGTYSERVRVDLPADFFLFEQEVRPVNPERLSVLKNAVRDVLGLPSSTDLLPGTSLGILSLHCKGKDIASFEWPDVHSIVIRDDVAKVLQSVNASGWHLSPVRIGGKYADSVPQLNELVVDGKAGKPLTDPVIQLESVCQVCGRERYDDSVLKTFSLNRSEWDGSDIFRFSSPFHGYVFVTAKIADALEQADISNYELQTIESFIESFSETNTGAGI